MELAMPWPASGGEWLAWLSAIAAILLGLAILVAPRPAARFRGMAAGGAGLPARGLRATSGFPLGVGLCAVLLAQPFIYLALGAAWIFSAIARLVGILAERDTNPTSLGWLVAETLLGVMPLAYVFGYVP